MAERAIPAFGGLLARFDEVLLRPPVLPADPGTAPARAAQPPGPALLDWCHGPGHDLRCAELDGQGAGALAEALALWLDGSLRLQACAGPAARLALRLGVKCADLAQALGRPPRRDDCWDSGWLRDGPAATERLAQWQPRRATLLLAPDRPPAQRQAMLAALAGPGGAGAMPLRPLRLARPVRWLWVREGAGPLAFHPLG